MSVSTEAANIILHTKQNKDLWTWQSAKAKKFHALYYHIATFKDLTSTITTTVWPRQYQLLQRLRDKPFWIWDIGKHKAKDIKTKDTCCFNHIIGLPRKDGKDNGFLPYQKTLYELYEVLQNHKHIWIKKIRGIGVTEFLLRYIA